MGWVELAAPATPAVDLTELKNHLRVTSADEDSLVDLYAYAATQLFEIKTRQRLINRSFRLDLPGFPSSIDPCGIELPLTPVSAITHVKYYDTAGVLRTWTSSEYILDVTSHLPRVVVAPTYVYPSTQAENRPNAVQVTFVAGYGTAVSSVPQGMRMGVFYLAAHAYTHRVPVANGTLTDIPKTLQYVIDAYKIWSA